MHVCLQLVMVVAALYEGLEQLGLWKKALHADALNEFGIDATSR
jgi:hypothetical protein